LRTVASISVSFFLSGADCCSVLMARRDATGSAALCRMRSASLDAHSRSLTQALREPVRRDRNEPTFFQSLREQMRTLIGDLVALDLRSLALCRIALGLLCCVDAVDRSFFAADHYADHGIMPTHTAIQ
jgi:hypothetical protein